MTKRDGTVYSSQHGRMCPHCGLPLKRCVCRANPRGTGRDRPAGDGSVRIRREKKGRAGKTVTTASGFALSDPELQALAKDLRRLCGSGGTVKDGVVEIQGDHADKLVELLRARDFEVKRAGG